MSRMRVTFAVLVSTITPGLVGAQSVDAGNDEMVALGRTLSVGVAAGFMRFDTNFKFTDPADGTDVFVDAEGTLGLPESNTIPSVYGFWRPSDRHGLGFGYFSARRESEALVVNENFGNLGVDGSIQLQDRTRMYGLTYNYTLFQDSRAYLFGSLGLNAIDIEYSLLAEGTLTLDGQPLASGELTESVNQFAPIPMIGLDGWFVLTPKWSFGARAAFVVGEVGNIKALVTESRIRAKYLLNKNASLILGVSYFDGDLEITDDSRITEINYGFDGFVLGIDVGF